VKHLVYLAAVCCEEQRGAHRPAHAGTAGRAPETAGKTKESLDAGQLRPVLHDLEGEEKNPI